jgi:hypothetical protein
VNECGACGEDFASVAAFDAHRVGRHAFTFAEGLRMEPPREDGRRCLHPVEMTERGIALNSKGRWQLIAKVLHAHRRFGNTSQEQTGPTLTASEHEAGQVTTPATVEMDSRRSVAL